MNILLKSKGPGRKEVITDCNSIHLVVRSFPGSIPVGSFQYKCDIEGSTLCKPTQSWNIVLRLFFYCYKKMVVSLVTIMFSAHCFYSS